MLIKQLWPIIKTKVKDPVLLMNTVNQCIASQPKNTAGANPPLIEDIELLTGKEIKDNKNLNANKEEAYKQHQLEI